MRARSRIATCLGIRPLAWSALLVLGCGSDDREGSANGGSIGCPKFDTTYEAVQAQIFEKKGCTQPACHGDAASGGLDLRAGKALGDLVDVPSSGSALARIQPGTANASYLYQKLRAATEPGSVDVAGSPMPAGGAPPLTQKELEAVRLWIARGAPASGNVLDDNGDPQGVGRLLSACLPETSNPAVVKPLDVPADGEGVQLVLPIYSLAAASEIEICTPFAFDFSDRVPDEFKDTARNVLFVQGEHVRQDAQSHHLILQDTGLTTPEAIAQLDTSGWTCRDGERDGQPCSPSGGSADCPAGVCAGESKPAVGCIGAAGPQFPKQLANAQAPQQYIPPRDGVYWEVPLKGILHFNSHAFNLTDEDTVLHGRINFYFARDRRRELVAVNDTSHLTIAAGQAPFTRKTYCAQHVAPKGASLVVLTGHTHRRGERFWVTDPTGELIYENFVYNDPLYRAFEPWPTFDAEDEAGRTLTYCATYNNGIGLNGLPDNSLVTRASRMPDRTSCKPVACVSGKGGEACTTDADCETSPGAGDGSCDACPITAGVTTENEMFVLMPWYASPEGQ